MKSLFVLATLVLLCSAVAFANQAQVDASVESVNEIKSTMTEMTTVSDHHEAIALVQAQARVAAQGSNGVERLTELLQKVLDRLERELARRKLRLERSAKNCAITIERTDALITKTKEQIRIKIVKRGIAKNDVIAATNAAAMWDRKAQEAAQEAARIDNRIKVRQSEIDAEVSRLNTDDAEKRALIKLLKKIDAKLKNNGLAEVGSDLSAAAAANSDAAVAALLEAAAAKSQSDKGDVQDVHAMIDLLIKQLQSEVDGIPASLNKLLALWAETKKSLIAEANAARESARSAVARRDAELVKADKAKALVITLKAEIKALYQTKKAATTNLKTTQARCAWEQEHGVKKQAATRRQIKVLKQVIAMVKNKKLSEQIVDLIKDVKLDLPVWQKGQWSECSAKCGLGKQTRAVACSAAKCLGNKPRTSRMCNLAPCKADCIVSAWSTWSECSAKCGGGVKKSSRSILARPVNGGKACPSSLGLQRERACNTDACPVVISPEELARREADKKALEEQIAKENKRIADLRASLVALRQKAAVLEEQVGQAKSEEDHARLSEELKQVIKQKKAVQAQLGSSSLNEFADSRLEWLASQQGQDAKDFCLTLAKIGTPSFRGCMQDMRLTNGNKQAAAQALRETQAAQRRARESNAAGRAVSRTCVSNGDPHTSNFNGDYFHIQVPGIYIFARTDDGFFEVQGKQDGSTGPGSPSWMRSCKIRYDGKVYDNVFDKDGFRVNCLHHQLTVTVPAAYQDHMEGICGKDSSLGRGAQNFGLKNGKQADVAFGIGHWSWGGYGGRFTKLSQWGLNWRPSRKTCMYSQQECEANLKDA